MKNAGHPLRGNAMMAQRMARNRPIAGNRWGVARGHIAKRGVGRLWLGRGRGLGLVRGKHQPPGRRGRELKRSLKAVRIAGEMYSVDGLSLVRQAPNPSAKQDTWRPKRVCVGGVCYERSGDGTRLQRSVPNRTLKVARNKVKRSISLIHGASQLAARRQYCLFYNRFGQCGRDKCLKIHDPSRVAPCSAFLRGRCDNASCLLSHRVDPPKMPSCPDFMRGACFRGVCCVVCGVTRLGLSVPPRQGQRHGGNLPPLSRRGVPRR